MIEMSELKYKVEKFKFSELQGKVAVPRFQRGLVWGTQKKRSFIRTLKQGLPIGTLLLYPEGDEFLIIDGLQRYTTMLDYSRAYFEYVEE